MDLAWIRVARLQNLDQGAVDEFFAVSWRLRKSEKYWGQRLYQQQSTSAQHTGTHHKQGQDTLPKHLYAGDVIRIWHLCTRFVRATKMS